LSSSAVTLSPCHLLPARETDAPAFAVHSTEGLVATGPLQELRDDWSVFLGGPKPRQVKGSDLVTLRQAGTRLPPPPGESQVIFANGDRIPGTVRGLTGQRLRFGAQLGTDQELELPLAALAVIWLAPPDATDDADLLRRRLATELRSRDVVLLRNGDAVEGTLKALDDKRLHLETTARKSFTVECGQVAAVALNTELARSLRPKGVYGRLVLANGCRLSLASARREAEVLKGKTLFGAAVGVPLDQVAALDLRQGPAVYLSDLKPRRYEHTPYLGVRWPYVADGSVAGRELSLGGNTYDKGVGMHSESRLTYDLAGRYQWFEAQVGLDDETGREGSVAVEVLLDGKSQDLGWDKELSGRQGSRPLRVRVAGARELTLVVKFGRRGDVHDHVNWADARLLK
jgi:hypothetical protein